MPPNIVPGWPPQRGQRIDQGLFHTYSIGPAAGGPGGGTPGIGNPQVVDPQQRKMLVPPGGGVGGGGGPGPGGGGGPLGGELFGGMGGPVFGGLGQWTGAILPGIGMAQGGVFAGDAAAALKSGPGVGTGATFTVGDLTGPQPAEILFPNSDRWDSAEGITEPVLSTGLGLGMGGNFTPSASLQRTGYFVSGDALRAVEEMLFNLILSDQHAGLFARIFWAPAFETDPLSAREFLQDQMELADAIVRLLFPGILDAGNEQTHGIRTHAELNRILREYARVTRPQENPDVKTTARVVSEVALQRSPVPKSTVFWIQELFARGGRRNGWIILDYLIVRPKDSLEINTRLKRSSVVSAVDMKITKSGKNERMRGDQQKDYLDTIGFLSELAQPDDTVVRAILAAASLVSVDFKQFPSPEDYLRQTVLLLREPCLLKLIHAVRSRDLSQIQDRFREFVQARWLLAGGSMTSGLEQFIMTSTQTFLGRIGLL